MRTCTARWKRGESGAASVWRGGGGGFILSESVFYQVSSCSQKVTFRSVQKDMIILHDPKVTFSADVKCSLTLGVGVKQIASGGKRRSNGDNGEGASGAGGVERPLARSHHRKTVPPVPFSGLMVEG